MTEHTTFLYLKKTKVSHLNTAQTSELINDYYSGMKRHNIESKFNLLRLTNGLPREIPLQILGENCSVCGHSLCRSFVKKEDYKRKRLNIPYCLSCGHKECIQQL